MQTLGFMKEIIGVMAKREGAVVTSAGRQAKQRGQESTAPALAGVESPTQLAAAASILAADACIEGNVSAQGSLQIHGTVLGNVQVPGGQVHIMRHGRVEGDISAQSVVINGEVQGVCTGVVLEILEHGRLQGTARAQRFSICQGGQFNGRSEQLDDVESLLASSEPGRDRQTNRKVTADAQAE